MRCVIIRGTPRSRLTPSRGRLRRGTARAERPRRRQLGRVTGGEAREERAVRRCPCLSRRHPGTRRGSATITVRASSSAFSRERKRLFRKHEVEVLTRGNGLRRPLEERGQRRRVLSGKGSVPRGSPSVASSSRAFAAIVCAWISWSSHSAAKAEVRERVVVVRRTERRRRAERGHSKPGGGEPSGRHEELPPIHRLSPSPSIDLGCLMLGETPVTSTSSPTVIDRADQSAHDS